VCNLIGLHKACARGERTGGSVSIEGSLWSIPARSGRRKRSEDHLHHRAGARRLPGALALAPDRTPAGALGLPARRQSSGYLDLEMRANRSALRSSSEEKYNKDNQHNAADADTAAWSVDVITTRLRRRARVDEDRFFGPLRRHPFRRGPIFSGRASDSVPFRQRCGLRPQGSTNR
jgi:hypothetical protein